VGFGAPGLNSRAIMLVPIGGLNAGISRCTPKASFIDPDNSLNFCLSISENENSSTKKASSNDIKSAKVSTQAGAPADTFFGASSKFT
jgi:hypothetical protein